MDHPWWRCWQHIGQSGEFPPEGPRQKGAGRCGWLCPVHIAVNHWWGRQMAESRKHSTMCRVSPTRLGVMLNVKQKLFVMFLERWLCLRNLL